MAEQHRQGDGRDPRRRGTSPGQVNIDLGFGELFKGIGNFLDLIGEMAEEGQSEVRRSGEIHGPTGVRGVYGFSVKLGLGGKPVVQNFGNIHSTEDGPKVSEFREPLADIFDEGDHVLVVVELPGVAESDISVEVKDDIITLSAEGRDRKYAKEILLPGIVDPPSLRRSYQNGVLEIRLDKVGKADDQRAGSDPTRR